MRSTVRLIALLRDTVPDCRVYSMYQKTEMPPTSAPLTALLLHLAAKHNFVRQNIEAGKVPSSQVLFTFLRTLVQEVGPHVKALPPAVGEVLKTGLAGLGWDVGCNAPTAGSSPPKADVLLAFLDGALTKLLPGIAEARAEANAAQKQAAEEERELSLMEEEALEGGLGVKQQKVLAASQLKVPQLKEAASQAVKLCAVVEARQTPEALAAADEVEKAQRGLEAMRIAQLTREAAMASSGKCHGRGCAASGIAGARNGRGGGGGGKGGGGGGRGGAASSEPLDREARAAATEARAASKAAGSAKTAEEALLALRQSDFTLIDASELRKGGYVLLPVASKEEPCRIGELTTSKTGKHGHAKISVTATDVASGRKVERNLRADEKVTVPGKRWIMAIGGGTYTIQ